MATQQHSYSNPNVPRDPGKYCPDEHAVIKAKRRKVDGWIIDYLFENGSLQRKGGGRYVLRAELRAIDPDDFEIRTDEWIMPIQITEGDSENIVTTSPYIMGIDDDELTAKINPIKPEGY